MADDADRALETQERLEYMRRMKQAQQRPIARIHDWCVSCGERIEYARLKAVPDANRCSECQSDFERYEAQYGR